MYISFGSKTPKKLVRCENKHAKLMNENRSYELLMKVW